MDRSKAPDRPADPTTASAPDRRSGVQPGTGRWLESSCDLRRGLTVLEGLPDDAGLDEWLEAMLRA